MEEKDLLMTTETLHAATLALPSARPSEAAYISARANAEGWGIFDCGLLEDGTPHIELQRIDCPKDGTAPFPDDGDARDHVVDRARAGSTFHQHALQVVDPIERCLIEARCGWWPGCVL